jgi:hypothetical protein
MLLARVERGRRVSRRPFARGSWETPGPGQCSTEYVSRFPFFFSFFPPILLESCEPLRADFFSVSHLRPASLRPHPYKTETMGIKPRAN